MINLQHIDQEKRNEIDNHWLTQWHNVYGIFEGTEHSKSRCIRFDKLGLLLEDSRRAALLRSRINKAAIKPLKKAELSLTMALAMARLLPDALRHQFTEVEISYPNSGREEDDCSPLMRELEAIFPQLKTAWIKGKVKTRTENKTAFVALSAGLLRAPMDWDKANIPFADHLTASDVEPLTDSLPIWGAKHPLFLSPDGLSAVIRLIPSLRSPKKVLSVLWVLEKIKADDFKEYLLPAGELPCTEQKWIKVCPFTGCGYFKGVDLPVNLKDAISALKPFQTLCMLDSIHNKHTYNDERLFSGKKVRFWGWDRNRSFHSNDHCNTGYNKKNYLTLRENEEKDL